MRSPSRRWLPLLLTFCLGVLGAAVSRIAPPPDVAAAPTATTLIPTLPPEAGLAWDVRDVETGDPIPCKLTLVGVDGSPTPQFTKKDIGRQEEGAIEAYNRIMASQGVGVAHVPHGTYDVYVSRGPEWDRFVARRVKVGPSGARVVAKLKHAVRTSGWISADMHVHAAPSPDSRVPMDDRIYEFLSDGVDLIVSTDHNVVSDYAPIIDEMGVGKYIGSIVGDELTTATWGHFGAFPLPQNREGAGHGAIHVGGVDAVGFFKSVRSINPDAVIDVHHPRIDNEIGYFNLAHFDAAGDRAGRPGWSYDFDAVEVLNGYQDAERRSIDRVLRDWYWLLDHGHIVTATGNSDTHHLDYNIGGYPRNYVRVLDDRPAEVTGPILARAIKHHRSLLSTGPFVKLHVNGADIGETVLGKGAVKVEVEVQAAPWVSVSSVEIIVAGETFKKLPVAPSEEVTRLKETLDVPVARDTWILARVDGSETLAPVVGDNKRFDVRPFAITNPVYVDTDGNGVYDAPHSTAQKAVPTR